MSNSGLGPSLVFHLRRRVSQSPCTARRRMRGGADALIPRRKCSAVTELTISTLIMSRASSPLSTFSPRDRFNDVARARRFSLHLSLLNVTRRAFAAGKVCRSGRSIDNSRLEFETEFHSSASQLSITRISERDRATEPISVVRYTCERHVTNWFSFQSHSLE